MDTYQSYAICLPNWGSVLPKLCLTIESSYETGSFELFEENFVQTGNDESIWTVSGHSGCELSIKIEKHEGYLLGILSGYGKAFSAGASILWDSYLEQGGNPEAQEAPRK